MGCPRHKEGTEASSPAGENGPAPEERDLLFENYVGNYYIAQFQTSRLIQAFEAKVKSDGKPDKKTGKPKIKSSHTIKYNGKWYRITTTIKELTLAELMSRD